MFKTERENSHGTSTLGINDFNDSMFVSIILATHNNEDTIKPCLTSLIHQAHPTKEIIVINDGSNDKTRALITEISGIRLIDASSPRGWAKARNSGLQLAKGDILFFAEGDAVYSVDYVSKAVECLVSDSNMAGVQVMGAPWKIRSTLVTECIEMENQLQHKRIKQGKMEPFYAWIFRRTAFESVGGFDERLGQGEDKDLFLRIKKAGYSIGLVPGIHWGHRRQEGTLNFMKKSIFRGKTRILFLAKHRKIAEFFRSVVPLWLLISLIVGSIFIPAALQIFILASSTILAYVTLFSIYRYWDCTERKKRLLFLPVFKIIRYISFAVGYTWGSLKMLYGKLTRKAISWEYLHSPQ